MTAIQGKTWVAVWSVGENSTTMTATTNRLGAGHERPALLLGHHGTRSRPLQRWWVSKFRGDAAALASAAVPRKPQPSPADRTLISHAEAHGFAVTARQLEIWRRSGLVPGNIAHGLGHGRGSASEVHPDARELVVWLARHSRRGVRPADLALVAFAAGVPVPEETVRAAFRSAIDRLTLTAEHAPDAVAEQDPADRTAVIAGLVIGAGSLPTLVPRRIRRIDDRLRDAGLSWPEAIARLDKGSSSPARMTTRDVASTALTMIRHGAPAISNQELGDVARALLPTGAASPLASMIEHLSEDPEAVSVQEAEGIVPVGDLRDPLRELTATTPLEILRLAWQTVDDLRSWAESLCTAVEAELDAHQPGEATLGWFRAAGLGARMFLVLALRLDRRTATEQAQSAAELLMVRDILRRLWHQMPQGSWELLNNPDVVPACFQPLVDPTRR